MLIEVYYLKTEKDDLQQKSSEINSKNEELRKKIQLEQKTYQKNINNLEKNINNLEEKLKRSDQKIENLDQHIKNKEADIIEKDKEIEAKEKLIQILNREKEEIETQLRDSKNREQIKPIFSDHIAKEKSQPLQQTREREFSENKKLKRQIDCHSRQLQRMIFELEDQYIFPDSFNFPAQYIDAEIWCKDEYGE